MKRLLLCTIALLSAIAAPAVPTPVSGGTSTDGPSLTALNHYTYNYAATPVDLAAGTALTVGKAYYDSLSANRTLTFSGTPAEGDVTSLTLVVTNAPTLTIPSCKRTGQANSAITSLVLTNGIHVLSWKYTGAVYYLTDSVAGLVDLASQVSGALPAPSVAVGALADGMTATTQAAGSADTKVATDAYADTAAKATRLGSHTTPDTTAGSITWTSAVYEVFSNTTTTYALPAASGYDRRALIIYVTGTNAVTIDPNASEVIVRDGTVQTGGVTMTLTGAAGNYVCLICDGVRWVTLGFKGTLAAGS